MDSQNPLFPSMFLHFVKQEIINPLESRRSDLETTVLKGRVATPGSGDGGLQVEIAAFVSFKKSANCTRVRGSRK